jgi:hypothetical protein
MELAPKVWGRSMLRPYILRWHPPDDVHIGGSMRARSLTIALALLAACSGGKTDKSAAAGDSLTERQRDSILAQSRIPGASGVGKAMRAADSTNARIRATDSVSP